MIDSEPVALRIAIGKQSALQHLVGRRPNAGDEIARIERRLLDVGELILWVAIQHQPANFD